MKKKTTFMWLDYSLFIKTKIYLLFFIVLTNTNTFSQQSLCNLPTSDCSDGDQIDDFILIGSGGTIINHLNSGCSAGGYNDQYNNTQLTVDMYQGGVYDVQFNAGYSSNKVAIWIDFDNDLDFIDSERVLDHINSEVSPSYTSTSITIPLTVTPGVKRMRVRSIWNNSSFTACSSHNYGETHDYQVNILQLPPCTGMPDPGNAISTISDACASSNIKLSMTGSISFSGLSYQWQSSSAGTNNFIDILGANGPTYSFTNQLVATDYRCVVECEDGNQVAYSSVVTVNQNNVDDCYCTPNAGGWSSNYYLSAISSTGGYDNFSYTASSYQSYVDEYYNFYVTGSSGDQITIDMGANNSTHYFYCWIDWNKDGDFDDTGETIWAATTSWKSSHTGKIDIPINQSLGEYRVRFGQTWSGLIGPCGTSNYGNYVDVKLSVVLPPPPQLTTVVTNVSCNGGDNGTATVSVMYGAKPFTYEWSPTGGDGSKATDLEAGIYTVTVTDAINQTVTDTIIIGQPELIVSNYEVENVSCNGLNDGTITINPSGGTPPYNILWSTLETTNTITDLSPGVYTVTITDINLCSVTENIVVDEPEVLSIHGHQTEVSLWKGSDGEATAQVSGGTAPYIFIWSNGAPNSPTASGLSAGSYTVEVLDFNGCSITHSFTISEPIPLMVVGTDKIDVSCKNGNDGSVVVDVIGGNAPYSYNWLPYGGNLSYADGLDAQMYTLEITDSTGNLITHDVKIEEPEKLEASLLNKFDAVCASGTGSATIKVEGGTHPYLFIWSHGVITSNPSLSGLTPGLYSVTVQDAKGCVAAQPVIVDILQPLPVFIGVQNLKNVSCFGANDGSISVNATGGTAPYIYTWSTGQVGESVQSLSPGSYTVTVRDSNNCIKIETFTITQPTQVLPPNVTNTVFCADLNPKLEDVSVIGSNVKWYDSNLSTNQLPISTSLVAGTTYYVTQTVGTCESNKIGVQFNLQHSLLLTTTQINVCSNTRIQNVVIDALDYTQLRWYNSMTSSTILSNTQILSSGLYFVSTYNNGCESEKYTIQVNVSDPVSAPIATAQIVCNGTKLQDLIISKDPAAELVWYSSLQSIVPISKNSTVSSGTYYVSQVLDMCESIKIPVPVQVVNVSVPSLSMLNICGNNITIEQFNKENLVSYKWYLSNVFGVSALPETFIINSGTYYISNYFNNCESDKVMVTVNVMPKPDKPTGDLIQSFDSVSTVADLKMNETNLKWFLNFQDAISNVNELPLNTILLDNTRYYCVSRTSIDCISEPTEVLVMIQLSVPSLDVDLLKFYPNPIIDFLNIEYYEEILEIKVFNSSGKQVLVQQIKSKSTALDLSGLKSGFYVLNVKTVNHQGTIRVIKK